MTKSLFFRLTILLTLTFLIIQSGCARTKPSRFYTLNSLDSMDIVRKAPSEESEEIIGIGPVEIPDYLDRPQIVMRESDIELRFSEFDRWAGSLKSDVSRVLVENISILLSTDHILIYPWERSIPLEYHVEVDITRFDGKQDGNILLTASWRVFGKGVKKPLVNRKSNFTKTLERQGYDSIVVAMSSALAELSRDIADEIKSISQKNRNIF